MENGIEVSAELIHTSETTGCFVVVKCEKSYYYKVLSRKGYMAVDTVNISAEDIGTCRVMVYDIEEDGLPYSTPAVDMEDKASDMTYEPSEFYYSHNEHAANIIIIIII